MCRSDEIHGGRLDPGVELLGKPYTRDQLARKVRQVLGNEAQHRIVEQQRARTEDSPRAIYTPSSIRLTILLVEDDDVIRTNTAELLKDADHVVIQARDADSALSALAAHPIDVLLTDVGLPKVSGVALARQVRNRRPDLAIVFATGDDAAAVEAAALQARLLMKPYRPEDLKAVLAGLAPAPAGSDV